MKEAFTVKLGKREAAWVEKQTLVFESKSLVLSTALRVLLAHVMRGTIVWELSAIQQLLQENSCNEGNERNQVPSAGGNAGCATNGSGPVGAVREIYSRTIRPCAVATEVRSASRITPFLYGSVRQCA